MAELIFPGRGGATVSLIEDARRQGMRKGVAGGGSFGGGEAVGDGWVGSGVADAPSSAVEMTSSVFQ
ncbi:MAG: hypothetical protein R2724_01440 [Bryobacterales bacterium]